MSDQKLKIAVFIDFDNVEIGVKTTLGLAFDIGAVLEAIKERGEVITKVAYGDWKRSGDHGRAMAQHAVRLVQRVMTPGGDKNGADINLALDALEMAFTHSHINAFVIVGGDSDFITLVEKLKQYDRKVFVVGGRAFTSQVMQKNCTEFIAYENVVPDFDGASRRARPGTARSSQERGERPRSSSTQPIEQAVPLVKRALKVLADREVSPQLGLLKSTLLQLDSSFSERDYGVSSFRDFADKLAQQGLVTLKHQGRSTLVELSDPSSPHAPPAEPASLRASGEPADDRCRARVKRAAGPRASCSRARRGVRAAETREHGMAAGRGRRRAARDAPDAASLGDGVALVRRVLGEATTPPRWPMYPRQFKQFLEDRAAGLRRAPLRIDRRLDARVPEGRHPAARARSAGRPARVCEWRHLLARVGAARVGPRREQSAAAGRHGRSRRTGRAVARRDRRADRGRRRARRRRRDRRSPSAPLARGRPRGRRPCEKKKPAPRKTKDGRRFA